MVQGRKSQWVVLDNRQTISLRNCVTNNAIRLELTVPKLFL
jgi:hypothetical protein